MSAKKQSKLYLVEPCQSIVTTFESENKKVEYTIKDFTLTEDSSKKYEKVTDSGMLNDIEKNGSSIMTNSNISREELEVKLELIEERLDRKVERIEHAVNRMTDKIELSTEALSKETTSIGQLRTDISGEIKSQRSWNIGTAIALLLGIAALFQWSGSILHTNTMEVSKAIASQNDLKIEQLIKEQEQVKTQFEELKNLIITSKSSE